VIINSFDAIVLMFSSLVTCLIIFATPDLKERMESQASTQYYCIAVIVTLVISLGHCKYDTKLIAALLVAAGVMMVSLYTGIKLILYLSVFMNVYVLTKIIAALYNSTNDCFSAC
jgi:hypothetical protein